MYVVFQSRSRIRHYVWFDSYAIGTEDFAAKTICGLDTSQMAAVNVGGVNPVNCKRCAKKFIELADHR